MRHFEDVSRDAVERMAAAYFWWESDLSALSTERLLAQVMDIGAYEDALELLDGVGPDVLRRVLAEARPGTFRPRSWSYWHFKLGVTRPGEAVPPMPKRRLA